MMRLLVSASLGHEALNRVSTDFAWPEEECHSRAAWGAMVRVTPDVDMSVGSFGLALVEEAGAAMQQSSNDFKLVHFMFDGNVNLSLQQT